ncbi:MAG: hypothetical protein EU551_03500 [Promethearchaeota archaeon]|nr:MAG: hypothetical protein EU551_03500 [Candidatus Lokiarchaeota archaeon]
MTIKANKSAMKYVGGRRRLYKLSPSAKFIFYIMNQKGAVNREYLSKQTLLSSRTIGQALKLLLEWDLIERIKVSDINKGDDKRLVKYRLIDRGGFLNDL